MKPFLAEIIPDILILRAQLFPESLKDLNSIITVAGVGEKGGYSGDGSHATNAF